MLGNTVYIDDKILKTDLSKDVKGEIVTVDDEKYYRISNYDGMVPFFMNIVSSSDLWMFISSNGGLTAGRKNPDQALFPYYTDDRIHDSEDITGSKTIISVVKNDKTFLWEPLSSRYKDIYNTERVIYKNLAGNKVIFEEINYDLSVSFQYSWQNCDKFGFIKRSKITNLDEGVVFVNILDGIQNILPYGVDRKFQLEYSTLLDGYKKNELVEKVGLGLYTLSSIPTDKAEPSEALRATSVWSAGLDNPVVLLSSRQLESFRMQKSVVQENIAKAVRGAYFLQSEFELRKGEKKEWYIAADLNKDHSDLAELIAFLQSSRDFLIQQIKKEIQKDTTELNIKVAKVDGFQLTNDQLNIFRHFSNSVFNIMRGGIFDNDYLIEKTDFLLFIRTANISLSKKYKEFFEKLPDKVLLIDLQEKIAGLKDNDFEKLCYEYMPLTFSRRHGDPSRPWNNFSIDIKDEHGNKILNYQGNWRDIFQNWEALAISFPGYIENMIVKFVNASTADGYNPYRVTKDGFDWEVLDPSDAWSYIGYWGDHQIVYLLKLLELSVQYHPGILQSFLTKEIFAYANVPYKIKPYQAIVADPHNTIEFDFKLDAEIREKVKEAGTDGKFIFRKDGEIYHVNLTEKLLVAMLVKLSNFIPEAGIWMNTQRPEWNDANNALVGYGASMVTLYYLRRFIVFCIKLFKEVEDKQIKLSKEVFGLFTGIHRTMSEFQTLLNSVISNTDRKKILDGFGMAGSAHREKIYSDGFSNEKEAIQVSELLIFFQLTLKYIEHSIKANKRDDDLYHAYNLIKINDQDEICIRHLYEMLEGQTAILSSGYLSFEDSIILINSLKKSRLYRKDQSSYLLYPDRKLAGFTEKNIIPKAKFEQSRFLQTLIENNDKTIVVQDITGDVHFNSRFRNALQLKQALDCFNDKQELTAEEERLILNIYESVFDHQSFTGRSGTFYKYEGLGCIYWHMVSKLLLAVQDTFYRAVDANVSDSILIKLKNYYYEIREGLGSHKQPELYGAFPTDPYSHTPGNTGVQQPGMTGQVKEDIISRFGELGLIVRGGKIQFNPILLSEDEFLTKSQVYYYYDLNGSSQSLMLGPGMLAYTVCQMPVVYIISKEQRIILTWEDGSEEEIEGLVLNASLSKTIFRREDRITKVTVLVNK